MTFYVAFDLQGQIQRRKNVPDIIPKLRQHAYKNNLKRWLASLDNLHIQELSPCTSPSSSNSRTKDWVPDIVRNNVFTCTKIILNNSWRPRAAYTAMAFDMSLDLQGQIQDQGRSTT